ncbi:MAG: hypothetical protein PSV46_09375 [Reyranella sp.]|nr:hypothetical protein [Reyranella sp.]
MSKPVWKAMQRLLFLGIVLLLSLSAVAQAADPTPAPVPKVRPIFFASGSSRGTIGGHVMRGQHDIYSLTAPAGQIMSVTVTAPDDNATFQIYEPGTTVSRDADGALEFKGQALRAAAEGEMTTRWTGRLPVRGTYLLEVGSTRGQARYSMDIRLD